MLIKISLLLLTFRWYYNPSNPPNPPNFGESGPSGLRRYDQNRNIPGLNPRRLPARTSRLLVGRRGVIGHSQLNPTSRPSTHPPTRNCGLEINDPPPHAKMRKDHIS